MIFGVYFVHWKTDITFSLTINYSKEIIIIGEILFIKLPGNNFDLMEVNNE